MKRNILPLEQARWNLARIWFSAGAVVFFLLVLQSLGGVYGEDLQRVWSWALPNFLPTLALMVSVFAADALKTEKNMTYTVQLNFYKLSMWLSAFYLLMLMLSILSPPLVSYFTHSHVDRIKLLETSNLWLAPLQSLVVAALGVLFFLKKDAKDIKRDEK